MHLAKFETMFSPEVELIIRKKQVFTLQQIAAMCLYDIQSETWVKKKNSEQSPQLIDFLFVTY